jgi:hypothetical protein
MVTLATQQIPAGRNRDMSESDPPPDVQFDTESDTDADRKQQDEWAGQERPGTRAVDQSGSEPHGNRHQQPAAPLDGGG